MRITIFLIALMAIKSTILVICQLKEGKTLTSWEKWFPSICWGVLITHCLIALSDLSEAVINISAQL